MPLLKWCHCHSMRDQHCHGSSHHHYFSKVISFSKKKKKSNKKKRNKKRRHCHHGSRHSQLLGKKNKLAFNKENFLKKVPAMLSWLTS